MSAISTARRVVMSAATLDRVLDRMAREIARDLPTETDLVLVGIQTGGVCLARHLAARLESLCGKALPVGQLDVAMHRDDLDQRLAPKVHPTAIPFDVTGKVVLLVDDVLFSGRTARAALDALNDLGRPKRVRLAVLIDRGHRELPICADFVGETLETAASDRVDVQLADGDGISQVVLESAAAERPAPL